MKVRSRGDQAPLEHSPGIVLKLLHTVLVGTVLAVRVLVTLVGGVDEGNPTGPVTATHRI